jgi:pimeloyl-ACP methyl ester carboxylesterase
MLVHGAFAGGWCWKYVRSLLEKEGFQIYTPTLTGMGERVHLATPQTTFQTHIDDIVAVIRSEELEDVVLVGHSSSGNLVAAVADKLPERIRKLVFFDGSMPTKNRISISLPPAFKDKLIDGYICPMPPLAAQGVPEDHAAAAWYHRRRTAMPAAVATAEMELTGAWSAVSSVYIRCLPASNPHAVSAAKTAKEAGITVLDLEATHAAQATAPQALAALLAAL